MNQLITDLLEVEPDVEYLRGLFDQITYSPEDNKLRLYPNERFDTDLWKYLKSIGLKWAPKQELFVFSHRISREDLCLFLLPEGEEIQPEGTTLAERAEIKAERLAGYYENRVRDMNAYSRAASSYSERFAQGQPILAGHHSQRSAETAKKRAESATRNSLDHERRANYWSWKIDGVAYYANMKGSTRTRINRIETLLKDLRDAQKAITHNTRTLDTYLILLDMNDEGFEKLAPYKISYDTKRKIEDGKFTLEGVIEELTAYSLGRVNDDYYHRVAAHILNRLAYENSLLPESELLDSTSLTNAILKKFLVKHGCPASPKETKLKLDKKTDTITVTLIDADLPAHLGIGNEVTRTRAEWAELMQSLGYTPPPARPKPPQLLNLNAKGVIHLKKRYSGFDNKEIIDPHHIKHMTSAQYKSIYSEHRGTNLTPDGKYRLRICLDPDASGPGYQRPWVAVYLTDAKAHPIPEGVEITETTEL